jgi:F-type H+-transporting ATPase subunit b
MIPRFSIARRPTRFDSLRRDLWRAPALAAWLIAAAPAFAWAEEVAEHHGNPWLDLAWKAVNLAVLVGLIVYFTRKPIGTAFRAMAKETQERWSGAHKAAQDAQTEIQAQRKQIEGLGDQLKRMVADAQADGQRESTRLVAEARAEADRILVNARQQVEQEVAKARNELREHLAEETLRLAEQMVREKVTPAERKRLMESYVRDMEARR